MPDIMELIEKFAHPDDGDVNESLVRALEATDTSDRKAAVDELVALNDLHAASRIFWVILNGSKLNHPLTNHSLKFATGDSDG